MEQDDTADERLVEELEEMRRETEEGGCRRDFESAQTRYQKLLDAAPDPMIFVNAGQQIVFANAQAEDLFGYTMEEMLCRRLEMLLPARYWRMHRGFVREFFSNPRRRAMGSGLKIYARRKDGLEFRADISLSPLRLDGEMLTVAAIRDITSRVREQEVMERNLYIQRAVDSILKISLEEVAMDRKMAKILDIVLSFPYLSLGRKGAVYLIYGDGESRELVLQAERGMDEEERASCRRIPLGKCICGRSADKCRLLFEECRGEAHELRFTEAPHAHYCVPILSAGQKPAPLGVMDVHVREGHMRDPDEESFLAAVSDIFSGMIMREKAETERGKLQANLAQAQKLAALGRVAANVSHAIRNPLTAVGGFAKRLQKKLAEGTREREYADLIAAEVDTLEEILKNVLAYSRVIPPRLEPHDIRKILDEVLFLHEDVFRQHSITVEKSYAETPEISVDRQQALEAIENIIVNAVDVMSGGGSLRVEVALTLIEEKPHVTVKIKDTGQGMDEELMEKIFEPFFSTKAAKGGAGLGLPISKKIMEEHGGSISVESSPGQGSTFLLNFPAPTP